jgi:hypothetical protein
MNFPVADCSSEVGVCYTPPSSNSTNEITGCGSNNLVTEDANRGHARALSDLTAEARAALHFLVNFNGCICIAANFSTCRLLQTVDFAPELTINCC